MKIRPVPNDARTNIRMCEDCKTKGKEGVFVTLGFFNGFVCNSCADELVRLVDITLRNSTIQELINNPVVFSKPETNLVEHHTALKDAVIDKQAVLRNAATLYPEINYFCSCGTAGAHPKNIHDTQRCDSPQAYDRQLNPPGVVNYGDRDSVINLFDAPDVPTTAPEPLGASFVLETPTSIDSRLTTLEMAVESLINIADTQLAIREIERS